MARRDLTGQKFGQLLVLQEEGKDKNGHIIWHCVCDCGKEKNYLASNLISGKTKSCGCIRSKGNQLILKELQKSNYIFDKEYKINYNDKIYFFDFVIFNKDNRIKCFIEFDGQQHYKYQESTTGWNNKEHFNKVQESDKQKNNYCKIHNIPLIRIPYWDYKKINLDYLKERIEECNEI